MISNFCIFTVHKNTFRPLGKKDRNKKKFSRKDKKVADQRSVFIPKNRNMLGQGFRQRTFLPRPELFSGGGHNLWLSSSHHPGKIYLRRPRSRLCHTPSNPAPLQTGVIQPFLAAEEKEPRINKSGLFSVFFFAMVPRPSVSNNLFLAVFFKRSLSKWYFKFKRLLRAIFFSTRNGQLNCYIDL